MLKQKFAIAQRLITAKQVHCRVLAFSDEHKHPAENVPLGPPRSSSCEETTVPPPLSDSVPQEELPLKGDETFNVGTASKVLENTTTQWRKAGTSIPNALDNTTAVPSDKPQEGKRTTTMSQAKPQDNKKAGEQVQEACQAYGFEQGGHLPRPHELSCKSAYGAGDTANDDFSGEAIPLPSCKEVRERKASDADEYAPNSVTGGQCWCQEECEDKEEKQKKQSSYTAGEQQLEG